MPVAAKKSWDRIVCSTCLITIIISLVAFGLPAASTASPIAGGANHAVAVDSDNAVLAWGAGGGDGFGVNRSNPVHVVDASGNPITDVQAVASGWGHTIALKTDGTLLAWGGNIRGQLGDGTTDTRFYAVPVVDEFGNPFNEVQAIAANQNMTIALKTDGSLWFWGLLTWGVPNEVNPTPVLDEFGDPITGIQAITAGGGHALALKIDGTMIAWGSNSYGELGDGTTTASTIPVPVVDELDNPVTDIQAIACGVYHSVALKTDGTVLAWGYNGYGQIGDGDEITQTRLNPVQVVDALDDPINDISAVVAGGYHTIALKNDGTLLAWGFNSQGQLGDGTLTNRYNPVPVLADVGGDPISCIESISAGNQFSLALKADGALIAWGDNRSYQLGDGTEVRRTTPVPVLNFALMEIKSVETRGDASYALKSDGTLLSWGANYYGHLGNGTTSGRNVPGFVIDTNNDPVKGILSVSASTSHVLALKSDGTVLSWGSNSDGQLGDGTTTNRYNPVQVVDGNGDPIAGIQKVSAGGSFSLALKADGTLLAWGEYDDGKLGTGSTTNQTRPIPVVDTLGNPITEIQDVSAGINHSLALKPNGTVLAWGANYSGMVGDGTTTDRYNPVYVLDAPNGNPITGVKAVFAGGQFSIALKSDNTLIAWGSNGSGRLGDGTNDERHNPVPVLENGVGSNPLTGIEMVAVGTTHALAIQSETSGVLGWGNNSYGQLGNNATSSNNPVPVAVVHNTLPEPDLATGFRDVSAGIAHSMALRNDPIKYEEGIAAWGRNNSGQLGDGSTTDKLLPYYVLSSGLYWLAPERASFLYQSLYLTESGATCDFRGDIDLSTFIDLTDAILALQILSQIEPAVTIYIQADLNGDEKIGLEEAGYILQKISELR